MKKSLIVLSVLLLSGAAALAQTGEQKKTEVIFEDPVKGEKVGGFPSRWESYGGEACQVVKLDTVQAIKLNEWYTAIVPKMKEENYLPEAFTIEFDVWSNETHGDSINDNIVLYLFSENREDDIVVWLNPAYGVSGGDKHAPLCYEYYSPDDEYHEGQATETELDPLIEANTWVKAKATFDKGAFKYYVNGTLVLSLNEVARPTRMRLVSVSNCDEQDRFFLRNIRIIKGI